MKIKLIVGLGNPGKKYSNTRHNMGFDVLDNVAKKLGITTWKERYGGLYFDTYIDMSRVIFLKPQKFINLSGDVMIEFFRFFGIALDDIIIISDDLDLPLGSLKLKLRGSSGGHNGLKNIEEQLKSNEYKRIKIGISNDKEMDTKDYVLGKLSKEEKKILNPVIEKATDAVISSVKVPFVELMNKYNTKNTN